MQPRDVVIVSACRTAIGKFQGMRISMKCLKKRKIPRNRLPLTKQK